MYCRFVIAGGGKTCPIPETIEDIVNSCVPERLPRIPAREKPFGGTGKHITKITVILPAQRNNVISHVHKAVFVPFGIKDCQDPIGKVDLVCSDATAFGISQLHGKKPAVHHR